MIELKSIEVVNLLLPNNLVKNQGKELQTRRLQCHIT